MKPLSKTAAEEPFVLTAMLSLVGATVWMQLRARMLLQFFYSAEMLALTHLVTLGFASSIVQGVMQRLAPRSFGMKGPSRRAAWIHCGLYLLGASGLVVHFALERGTGMAWSAGTLLVAALGLCWNFRQLFGKALAPGPAGFVDGDWGARWVAASLVHFVLAAFLGASYATAKTTGFGAQLWSAPLLERLGAHLHLALVGWIGGAIHGYQRKLLPAVRASPRVEAVRFVLVQGGLLGLVVSLLVGSESAARLAAPVFAATIALGIALDSVPAIVRMGHNLPGLWETVAHGLLLALAGVGVALAFGFPAPDSDLRFPLELAYAFVALLGWVLLTVMGTSWKLFATWVWEERFLPEKGTKPIPPVRALSSKPLVAASGAAITIGALGVAGSIVASSLPALRLFLVVHAAGVLCFVVNFARIARWELLQLEYRPREPGRADATPR
jgi:hypothetical protein